MGGSRATMSSTSSSGSASAAEVRRDRRASKHLRERLVGHRGVGGLGRAVDVLHRRRDIAMARELLYIRNGPDVDGPGAEGVTEVVEDDRLLRLAVTINVKT